MVTRLGRSLGKQIIALFRLKLFVFLFLCSLKGHQQHIYSGDRTLDALLEYARRMSGPPVQLVTRAESMDTLRTSHDLFFVYVGKQAGPVWDIYHSVAATFQAHGFFYAAADAVAGKHVQMEQTPCVAVCKANASYHFPSEYARDDGRQCLDGRYLCDFAICQWRTSTSWSS